MLYALHRLSAPGTLVAGYQRGDEIREEVAEAWELVLGEDVSEERPDLEPPAPVVPRPGPGDNRVAWETWARANGMSEEDAAAATQDDLESFEPAANDERVESGPVRPADSAKKAEWVTYVSKHPQATAEDQAWAGDDATTKADLQAWQPGPARSGDPVAEAATEQANG